MDLTLVSPKDAKGKELLHTTSEHPFLTQEKSFTPAGQLHAGMHVRKADGTWGVVEAVKVVNDVQVMYNLEVAQDHTFVVGDGEWIVHNVCFSTLPGRNVVGSYRDVTNIVRSDPVMQATYQVHHIYQDASMRTLRPLGYSYSDAPAIALYAGRRTGGALPVTPHGNANAMQDALNAGFQARRFTNLSFADASSVAQDTLRAAGVTGADFNTTMNYATNYFQSRFPAASLNHLAVPQ